MFVTKWPLGPVAAVGFTELEQRKAKVQRAGTPMWVVENMEPLITFRKKLRLELLGFSLVGEKDLHRSCWELLLM